MFVNWVPHNHFAYGRKAPEAIIKRTILFSPYTYTISMPWRTYSFQHPFNKTPNFFFLDIISDIFIPKVSCVQFWHKRVHCSLTYRGKFGIMESVNMCLKLVRVLYMCFGIYRFCSKSLYNLYLLYPRKLYSFKDCWCCSIYG